MHQTDPSNPIICLMGPTACGKTDLAIALATHFPIEIINVDSAQIYKGMDIGSGKPCEKIRKQVVHHLMDFLDPSVPYSAAQFRLDAINHIQAIQARNRIPLLVGGTMLYFKVLQEGIAHLPQAHTAVRSTIEQKATLLGWEALHQELVRDDPVIGAKIKVTDTQRIQRALEIIHLTGKPMSYWLAKPKEHEAFNYVNIGLLPLESPRAALHERIATRFITMLQHDFVSEVKRLRERPDLHLALPSMRAVGYRQVWQYLAGELSYEHMSDKAIASTRQLAKRQLTWLRQWPNLRQYDFLDPELFTKVKLFLQAILKEK